MLLLTAHIEGAGEEMLSMSYSRGLVGCLIDVNGVSGGNPHLIGITQESRNGIPAGIPVQCPSESSASISNQSQFHDKKEFVFKFYVFVDI